MQQATLCFLVDQQNVLLAMKKRGFGAGKWNGVGGKVEVGETPVDAAIRETHEEILVNVDHYQYRGYVDFLWHTKPEWNARVHLYVSTQWQGTPQETEEMKPQWFTTTTLPLADMWPDDAYWLPMVLAGKTIHAVFYFHEGAVIDRYDIQEVAR